MATISGGDGVCARGGSGGARTGLARRAGAAADGLLRTCEEVFVPESYTHAHA